MVDKLTEKSARTKTETAPTNKRAAVSDKRVYFRQSDFQLATLQQAQKIAAGLVDNYASDSASPPDIALAIGISPTSSQWKSLTGASIAYSLTDGGINANLIKLTNLGRRLVAPEEEGQDIAARREAILKPRILREFFEKYRRAKFPGDQIAINVLKVLGLPADRGEAGLEIVKANGVYAGIIRDTPTGLFVNLDSPAIPAAAVTREFPSADEPAKDTTAGTEVAIAPVTKFTGSSGSAANDKVFISHGKQKAIVTQIKELLEFGKFQPVVSVEREATAISVPEKVFEDMRSCSAGVIHVGGEGKYLDQSGAEHTKLNDNVLIEIGAAMALYGKKIVLLVERGVSLPSNLQGLYRCEFEGDKLDYESTMKLLKTFSQFR
jgi:hypothetical protein